MQVMAGPNALLRRGKIACLAIKLAIHGAVDVDIQRRGMLEMKWGTTCHGRDELVGMAKRLLGPHDF